MMKLRLGVSDDPTALQPSLSDCLGAMLKQAEALMQQVLQGLELGTSATGPQRLAPLQAPQVRAAVLGLEGKAAAVKHSFVKELTRLVYEGGGKDQTATEVLRFQDLQLFEDEELDQSIEIARAQQEVVLAVDDTLPPLDALISTMLGWRTIQPGLNPLRPEVFVRALQHTLAEHVAETGAREVLITPAAGLLGVNLRKLYRELADWLRSTGVEPAVPVGGRINRATGASGAPVTDTVAKTLLTLDRLRKLLAGDFDQPRKAEFLHTMPASMALLQDLKKTDELVKRLEQRKKPVVVVEQPVDMLADAAREPPATGRIGQQLGEEVVRLMFDNLLEDRRLLPTLKRELKVLEPAVHRLTKEDSRFFSDRNHPARQLLDRIIQRSLAFPSEEDAGWPRFLESLQSVSRWLESKVMDADTFGEMLDELQAQWTEQDQGARQKREEAARALLHAEQRNLLAQKLASDFADSLGGLDVADFIRDFLKNAWAQVVAEAQLSCEDGSPDPYGYRAMVDDLIWSVQKTTAQRGRARRLVQMIPGLLQRLREGLGRIGYPQELTQRFFDHLITLHRAAVQEGRDASIQAAADAAWSEQSQFPEGAEEDLQLWLDSSEAQESGFIEEEADLDTDYAASPEAPRQEALRAEQDTSRARQVPSQAPQAEAQAGLVPEDLRIGAWVEIRIKGDWVRAQLTWCSPHATLFMFTSIGGAAHSMSRRTMEKLRTGGQLRVVAERPVVDEALDQVARAALKNSVGRPPE
ncbi:DUF1631 family protein [Ramlibacter alkalitolerans]|uniref:DUF1631 family protein n=1 Tax=Ramlibacter alkalitolerans TaxID=2039631 RepID=A0ABS1JJ47_9BURK|nr:DUF1631 family protein [Ramlibacter alkalitolerans]MBL0424248.1 DUF1631 family protein [Ramlibacter alkalitolerans]